MFRFRRVNIDGKSITETRAAGAELKPGELVKLEGGKFVKATTAEGRLYIVNPAFHEGKTIADAIAMGETVVADYFETGREFAMRVALGTYTKDQAIQVNEVTVAYCQEDVKLEAEDFIRVRVA
nr:MAG TPA: capsid stabilizing protein [Caudoviricetes sp.]